MPAFERLAHLAMFPFFLIPNVVKGNVCANIHFSWSASRDADLLYQKVPSEGCEFTMHIPAWSYLGRCHKKRSRAKLACNGRMHLSVAARSPVGTPLWMEQTGVNRAYELWVHL